MAATVDPQRILIIRPSALGDVCRTVPVLASLRQAFPAAKIDWVVQDDFAPAVEAHPGLSELIEFPRARFARWWKSPRACRDMLGWFLDLFRRRYDTVLDCQGLGRSGLMTFMTAARRRVGLRSARELAWLGYNVPVLAKGEAMKEPVHTVDRMLMLLSGLPGVPAVRDMRLYVAETYRRWWHRQRELMGIPEAPYAVLAPTSRWLSKRWPIDRFAQLVEPLRQRGFARVLIIGAPSEMNQVRELFNLHPPIGMHEPTAGTVEPFGVIDQVGGTNIGQTMAMIAEAGLVVANDSAPLHMAVGFNRPCVGLFGPTDPAIVGPYQMEESVVRGYVPQPGEVINFKCPRLGNSLMRYISTAAVLQRIDHVLSGSMVQQSRIAVATEQVERPTRARPVELFVGPESPAAVAAGAEDRAVIGRIPGPGGSRPSPGTPGKERGLVEGTGS